jgi:ubiquinone/menaquinone biosynthesis C-methylase UbiE
MGAFAVGIDLNPGYRNPYVLYGDFHKLAFPDASVDVVFTNSLDHALDTAQVAAEAHRVLRDAGILMVDAMDFGERETSYWESAAWSDVNDLIAVLTSGGFTVISREAIMNPWRGTSLWLKKILE